MLPAADRALEWIDTYGDRNGDGFVEYRRATDRGLAMSYHNGSVWPHDSAIAAAGLARYGYRVEAQTVDGLPNGVRLVVADPPG